MITNNELKDKSEPEQKKREPPKLKSKIIHQIQILTWDFQLKIFQTCKIITPQEVNL